VNENEEITALRAEVLALKNEITDRTLLVYQARWLLGRAQCKLAGNASTHWLASVNDFMSRSQL
jgi:hypothetical protein